MFPDEIKQRELQYKKDNKMYEIKVVYGNTFEILRKYKELKNGLYEDSNRWKVYVRLMNKQLDTTKLIERVDITYGRSNSMTSAPFEYHS